MLSSKILFSTGFHVGTDLKKYKMNKFLFQFFFLGLILGCSVISFAQDPKTTSSNDTQPYEKIIPKDAISKSGIFTVHKVKDKYYYEIPKGELNKEFLWVTRLARTTSGVGYSGEGLNQIVVRWEQNDNKINLRSIKYDLTADSRSPISEAVRNANNDTILMSFTIAASGLNDSVVIEVTRLFTSDIFEFSARERLLANAFDPTRSYIERISPFPTNIEVETTNTYTRTAQPGSPLAQYGIKPGSATVVIHHSMVKMPEKPMIPRLLDERVGYFSASQTDYSRPEPKATERRFIVRFRLEKKDPGATVSEPVKPIVYYIDRATPTWLVPYIKRGVEKWQKAFEAAGYRNAVIAKMQPSVEEDPEFDLEDARYSVIRWLPSTLENASGRQIYDPRTGEVLVAYLMMSHNIMNSLRSQYFVQAAPLDPRAQKLPMPDELMGALVESTIAHEVGHTLGLQHNMKASSLYPQEKVRDRDWLKKMGHAPSIMDYSRFNYVAQPEDKVDPADLVPKIGPYDIWAINWGYRLIPGVVTPDQERPFLDEWAREQDKIPWLRFSTAGANESDPGELTEAVGDSDAVKSTALGITNLKRVAQLLIPATTTQKGSSYNDLNELYSDMLEQWVLELNHVTAIVGGFDSRQRNVGQDGVRFQTIAKERQSEAMRFLNENAFVSPTWQIDEQILRRIEPAGALNRIGNAQKSVLNNLLSSSRFARLVEQETLDGENVYSPKQFMSDIRSGIWTELFSSSPLINPYRRNLQRSYLQIANLKINASTPTTPQGFSSSFDLKNIISGDERGFYRMELRELSTIVEAAILKTTDRETRIHLEDVRDQIDNILDLKPAARSQ